LVPALETQCKGGLCCHAASGGQRKDKAKLMAWISALYFFQGFQHLSGCQEAHPVSKNTCAGYLQKFSSSKAGVGAGHTVGKGKLSVTQRGGGKFAKVDYQWQIFMLCVCRRTNQKQTFRSASPHKHFDLPVHTAIVRQLITVTW